MTCQRVLWDRLGCGVAMLLMMACAPSSLVTVRTPSTIVDPSLAATPDGALKLYNQAVMQTYLVLGGSDGCYIDVACTTALFTDELTGTSNSYYGDYYDNRQPVVFYKYFYQQLHTPRIQAQQARQALALYAPNAPSAYRARLFALEGYTVIYFAELFCSGIPLSTVPLVGTPTATAGFTTQELFAHAIALFDSALAVATDSTDVGNLARVGKGRALLGMGRQTDAAAAVRDVPTAFVYQATYASAPSNASNMFGVLNFVHRVQDAEGTNGLVWSTDPRTAIVTTPAVSGTMLRPAKYLVTATGGFDPTVANPAAPMHMADGLEARLIEVEADLAAGNTGWLTRLNALRAQCVGTDPCAPVPGLTGAQLPPLGDPGTASARLDLFMKERAMWLYLTGHRQGDLRRLAHVYHRDPLTLWPIGFIVDPPFPPLYTSSPANNGVAYGNDYVFSPNAGGLVADPEKSANGLYGGCNDLQP